MKKQLKKSKLVYIIFAAVLVVLAAAAIIYVFNVLSEYEASQPEKEIERQLEKITGNAKKGTLDSIVSFEGEDGGFEITEEEKKRFISALSSDKLTYKLMSGSSDGSALTYSVSDEADSLLYIKLKSLSEKTKLSLFTYSEWKTEEVNAALFNLSVSLPPSITVKLNGNVLQGSPSSEDPQKLLYNISAFGKPKLVISDGFGNELECKESTKIDITEYTVTIPDNYTLKIGGNEVDSNTAEASDNPDYSNVAEYCSDMPKLLTYSCAVLKNEAEIEITDPMGQPAQFDKSKNVVKITEQPSYSDSVPEELLANIDPTRAAKDWSLFLTQDLNGANYGFNIVASYLDENSYLYDVAWKYANGIDITFTSPHSYPTFADEKISNYIRYTDSCFSCDVFFNKNMLLNTGTLVTDTMNSTFFFVNIGTADAPKWIITDIKEII